MASILSRPQLVNHNRTKPTIPRTQVMKFAVVLVVIQNDFMATLYPDLICIMHTK